MAQETKPKLALEELCHVGDPFTVDSKGKKYPTVFRGAKENMYVLSSMASGGGKPIAELTEQGCVLVDIPVIDGKQRLFEYNAPLMVYFLSDGVVYAFKSFMLRVHPKPGVIALEYPTAIQKHSLRKSERVELVMPVTLVPKQGGDGSEGAAVDLSATGLRIAVGSANGYRVGEMVLVSGTLPSGVRVERLPGHVRNVQPENGRYYLGVSFGTGGEQAFSEVLGYYEQCRKYM